MTTTNETKTIVFCGDHHAKKSIYLKNTSISNVPGMPINDTAVKQMLKRYRNRKVVFFSCGYPLMGCKEVERIKALQSVNINLRLIPYHHKPTNRGFYLNDWWKTLTPENINLLFQNWAQMLNYYCQ